MSKLLLSSCNNNTTSEWPVVNYITLVMCSVALTQVCTFHSRSAGGHTNAYVLLHVAVLSTSHLRSPSSRKMFHDVNLFTRSQKYNLKDYLVFFLS